jgi:hypothetical protein
MSQTTRASQAGRHAHCVRRSASGTFLQCKKCATRLKNAIKNVVGDSYWARAWPKYISSQIASFL